MARNTSLADLKSHAALVQATQQINAAGRKVRAISSHPEQDLHKAVAQYLHLALPEEYEWTTIGHGGGGALRGAILKATGVKPGWPDIIILKPVDQHLYTGLVRFLGIELKAHKGSPLSNHQKHIRRRIFAIGGHVHVCRSLEQVQGCLRAEMIPLRINI